MSLREKINKNPRVGVGVAAVVLVLAALSIAWQSGGPPKPPGKGFYTTDDGKTYFTDEVYRATPFEHDGKQAYGAIVLKCANGGEPFVAYVSRLGDRFLKEAKAMEAKREANFTQKFEALQIAGLEVKKPGQSAWLRVDSGPGQKLVADAIKCPDGSTGEPVLP
jgi:hypothetical protein